jgi:hypothetical protein
VYWQDRAVIHAAVVLINARPDQDRAARVQLVPHMQRLKLKASKMRPALTVGARLAVADG